VLFYWADFKRAWSSRPAGVQRELPAFMSAAALWLSRILEPPR